MSHIKCKGANTGFFPLLSAPSLFLFCFSRFYPTIYSLYSPTSVFFLSFSLSVLSLYVYLRAYTCECGYVYVLVHLVESKEFWVGFIHFPSSLRGSLWWHTTRYATCLEWDFTIAVFHLPTWMLGWHRWSTIKFSVESLAQHALWMREFSGTSFIIS